VVDAAVGVALALAVVHPAAGNLGGGGFALVRQAGAIATLDFRETAPAAATADMYLDREGNARPDASLVGPLAAGVPGSPAGLYELHRRFGRLPWPEVVEPAIRMARDGFTVTPRLEEEIGWSREDLARFPETAAVWLPGGSPPAAGTVLRLPDLAATLAAYAARGPDAIAGGPVAAAVIEAARRHGGILTAADLADYRPIWRPALRLQAYGWEIATMDLPSSGGIILAQTLRMFERLGWERLPRDGPDRAHLAAETWRRSFADRFLLGDPANGGADAARLLADPWIAARADAIDRRRATPSSEVLPWPGTPPAGSPETTHLSVVDPGGDVVALTTTLNGSFGCGLYVPRAGFFLNNEMDDFTTVPGKPNMFGLMQGEANRVKPGRRMLSSMTPTIAWRGAEVLALGSPGGSHIPTATAQVFLAVAVDGDPLAQAVERKRIHHQWLPDRMVIEPGALPDATIAALRARGHAIHTIEDWYIGEVDAVRRRGDGVLEAAADARGPGGAGLAPQPGAAVAPPVSVAPAAP
jgi:gamma-glutamyltranspeptidase/glutathione hydrolase